MKFLRSYVAIALPILVLIAGAVASGSLNRRWASSEEMNVAAARLVDLPRSFGPWRLVEEKPFSKSVCETLACAGHISARFVNDETKREVNAFVIVGPPGQTSVHRPDICLDAQSFKSEGPAKAEDIVSDSGQKVLGSVWVQSFDVARLDGSRLMTAYAWSDGNGWSASVSPRLMYGGGSHLYKVQADMTYENAKDAKIVMHDFFEHFLPALDTVVIPAT